ncbi:MAG: DUF5320 domain-containing protein [Dehalococcoidia bacterium]|nr:DUF5320 domain-containing protein [Dehalococcoidia bacterium]
MPYGFGYGRGLRFRGTSPAWPYVGRGRGGLPRCWSYRAELRGQSLAERNPAFKEAFNAPRMDRIRELDFLKEEARALQAKLEEVSARIKELESR